MLSAGAAENSSITEVTHFFQPFQTIDQVLSGFWVGGGVWMSDGLLWSCDLLGGGGNTLPIASSLFQLILSTVGLSLCYPLVFRCPWRGGIILFWGVFLCFAYESRCKSVSMWCDCKCVILTTSMLLFLSSAFEITCFHCQRQSFSI